MIIRDVIATNLTIPYDVPYRPAWQPGIVRDSRTFTDPGRSVKNIDWYTAFALWKLAMIVEGAYAQYRDGRLRTPYAAALEHDVPALLRESAQIAGVAHQ